jgi:FKBP12-rapamycin complex-associated protein
MLVNAMEVTGIEGTYRITCEKVMQLLRNSQDCLNAVLEAFVYDPLLSWDLTSEQKKRGRRKFSETMGSSHGGVQTLDEIMGGEGHNNDPVGATARLAEADGTNESTTVSIDEPHPATDSKSKKALVLISRVRDKLTGRDFDRNVSLDVPEQVDLLIQQATSHELLCQCYIGWCPFW